jgi:hypothetical protein
MIVAILAILSAAFVTHLLLVALVFGSEGLVERQAENRLFVHLLLLSHAGIATMLINSIVYLYFSMVMNVPMYLDGAGKPLAMMLLGSTFAVTTILSFALFYYGSTFKPKLRLGAYGKTIFNLE